VRDTVREWLPAAATLHDAVRAPVEASVGAWSRRWFAAPGCDAATITPVTGVRSDAGDAPWRVHGSTVATRLARGMTGRLAERALGRRPEGHAPTAGDRRVLAAFAERIVADLAAELETRGFVAAAEAPPGEAADPFGPLGGALVRVGDGRETLVSAAIPREALVRVCKAGLPPRAAQDRPARSIAVVAETAVRIEASLGSARLTLAELRGLSPGDVVVLDTLLDAGVELSPAPGCGAPALRARLGELGERLTLTLQPEVG
jgi:flagellar motor switch/type III secretory pathway protein FliN